MAIDTPPLLVARNGRDTCRTSTLIASSQGLVHQFPVYDVESWKMLKICDLLGDKKHSDLDTEPHWPADLEKEEENENPSITSTSAVNIVKNAPATAGADIAAKIQLPCSAAEDMHESLESPAKVQLAPLVSELSLDAHNQVITSLAEAEGYSHEADRRPTIFAAQEESDCKTAATFPNSCLGKMLLPVDDDTRCEKVDMAEACTVCGALFADVTELPGGPARHAMECRRVVVPLSSPRYEEEMSTKRTSVLGCLNGTPTSNRGSSFGSDSEFDFDTYVNMEDEDEDEEDAGTEDSENAMEGSNSPVLQELCLNILGIVPPEGFPRPCPVSSLYSNKLPIHPMYFCGCPASSSLGRA